MSHENTETVETKKGSGIWINKRTVNKNKPMNPEQKRFFAKKFKTRDAAELATDKRSERYKVRERQRIKKKK
mgnify:CR=1 FL=1|jgi:hypothetical protein